MVGYRRPARMGRRSSVAMWATARNSISETPTRRAAPRRTPSPDAPTRAAALARMAICSAR
eukprot:4692981-Alexandrium_andersonii.AAC.1